MRFHVSSCLIQLGVGRPGQLAHGADRTMLDGVEYLGALAALPVGSRVSERFAVVVVHSQRRRSTMVSMDDDRELFGANQTPLYFLKAPFSFMSRKPGAAESLSIPEKACRRL